MSDSARSPNSPADDAGSQEITQDIKNAAAAMSKAVEKARKLDDWSKVFAERLKEDEARLSKQLEDAVVQITEDRNRFEKQFHELMTWALAPHTAEENDQSTTAPTVSPSSPQRKHELFRSSALYYKESMTLLQECDNLFKREIEESTLSQIQRLVVEGKDWIAEAITAGAKVTKADVEGMLAGKYNEVKGKVSITKKEENLGRDLISHDRATEVVNGTWGDTAQHLHAVAVKMCGGIEQ